MPSEATPSVVMLVMGLFPLPGCCGELGDDVKSLGRSFQSQIIVTRRGGRAGAKYADMGIILIRMTNTSMRSYATIEDTDECREMADVMT
jgi:hypothetical protein